MKKDKSTFNKEDYTIIKKTWNVTYFYGWNSWNYQRFFKDIFQDELNDHLNRQNKKSEAQIQTRDIPTQNSKRNTCKKDLKLPWDKDASFKPKKSSTT